MLRYFQLRLLWFVTAVPQMKAIVQCAAWTARSLVLMWAIDIDIDMD
jgi:hypothetical protein